MTNKTEPTNEQIAEWLGWKFRDEDMVENFGSCWILPGGSYVGETPDFLNDLNASWKYVWPELDRMANKRYNNNFLIKIPFIKELLLRAYESDRKSVV